jgi:hypothetical protein
MTRTGHGNESVGFLSERLRLALLVLGLLATPAATRQPAALLCGQIPMCWTGMCPTSADARQHCRNNAPSECALLSASCEPFAGCSNGQAIMCDFEECDGDCRPCGEDCEP